MRRSKRRQILEDTASAQGRNFKFTSEADRNLERQGFYSDLGRCLGSLSQNLPSRVRGTFEVAQNTPEASLAGTRPSEKITSPHPTSNSFGAGRAPG